MSSTDRAEPATDPLLALAERVERGDDDHAEINGLVWCYTNDTPHPTRIPNYMRSLDAIASLQEAVLTGWRVSRVHTVEYGDCSKLNVTISKRLDCDAGEAPTLHQAWLAALLRAVAMERRTLQGDPE